MLASLLFPAARLAIIDGDAAERAQAGFHVGQGHAAELKHGLSLAKLRPEIIKLRPEIIKPRLEIIKLRLDLVKLYQTARHHPISMLSAAALE